MKKINPLLIFNVLIFMFIGLGLSLICFFIHIKMGWVGFVSIIVIVLFLGFIMYSINFGIPTSNKINNKIEEQKKSLVYTNEKIIIINPILEKKTIIYWKNIEAIFLLNKSPLDGEYHNFEYIIILNREPENIKYEFQKWYNKLRMFNFSSKSKENQLPIIKINDYNNKDFNTFKDAVNKYLLNVNETSSDYFKLKFGNKVEESKIGNTKITKIKNPIKTIGFYEIFDHGNDLNDKKVIEYREQVKNK
ncbi:hypothetical protein [Flavobacterium piscis]|uniref:Uncharacterized protein n=1 Tax=Flavobacterium piscis TaxID=1114874 RepID=A0ABU1YB65_9FLAO|nr:hypothetical protein [Flavobacterium piscis]MDR7211478.1 hypothetical protein [Flavobacterium piscis]